MASRSRARRSRRRRSIRRWLPRWGARGGGLSTTSGTQQAKLGSRRTARRSRRRILIRRCPHRWGARGGELSTTSGTQATFAQNVDHGAKLSDIADRQRRARCRTLVRPSHRRLVHQDTRFLSVCFELRVDLVSRIEHTDQKLEPVLWYHARHRPSVAKAVSTFPGAGYFSDRADKHASFPGRLRAAVGCPRCSPLRGREGKSDARDMNAARCCCVDSFSIDHSKM